MSVALAAFTAAAFWSVLHCGFVQYDDPVFVLQNPMVQRGITGETLAWALTSLYVYWQPLTWVSYMVDFALAGPHPMLFHATNLALHIASTVILFLALRRMTGALWCSAAVAALFALHPLHVESVAWVSERKGVLSGLFWMLALWSYARHAERPRTSSLLLVTAFFALGLMSKSIVVTLPCALLLLDIWPLRRWAVFARLTVGEDTALRPFPLRTTTQLIGEKVPLFLLALVSSALTVVAQKQMGAMMSTTLFSVTDRLAIAVTSYASYLRKLCWPTDLAAFYPNPGTWPAAQVVGAGAVLTAITAFSLWNFRRRPCLLVGWLWFLGVMLPVNGLLQTGEQVMADRYTYLPLTGVFLMIVWSVADGCSRLGRTTRIVAAVGGVLLLGCAVLTSRQLQTWKDTRSLFEHALAVTQNNYLAHTVLGSLLTEAGEPEEAIRHFQAALKVQPYYAETHHRMASALAAQGKFDEAIRHLQEARRVDPANPDLLLSLARVLEGKGEVDQAVATYEQLLARQPPPIGALHQFAGLLHRHHRYAQALDRYRQCLRLDPSRFDLMNNLAWILATHTNPAFRNGAEAVQLAEQACRLTDRKVPVLIGTLAAAYAEVGRFDKAVEAAGEARLLAERLNQPEVAARNTQLLEVYRSGKPWREATP